MVLYIRENITIKSLIRLLSEYFDEFFVRLNLRKKEYSFLCSYNLHKSIVANCLDIIGKALNIPI